MKITGVDLTPIASRRETGEVSRHFIIRLHTDGGLVGLGEMSVMLGLDGYQMCLRVLACRTGSARLAPHDPRIMPICREFGSGGDNHSLPPDDSALDTLTHKPVY